MSYPQLLTPEEKLPAQRPLGSAILSDCERYRYLLGREWAVGPTAVFVMLNPSTADALRDDPTIRRCLRYAQDWGCGALMVANLYAWRATEPADLWLADDPVGPENDAHLYAAAAIAAESGGPLVGAWGANARPDRIAAVLALPGMDRLTALAVTKAGQPKHPLYLKADLTPQPWSRPAN
ncbi:hypothetical protein SMD44_00969 [Streptomyces alboflavus]|uniref:DUF1643 domain-containing protein n=1 Tax=Streptomyces alboflavus TaxID=67267 RepID=A0A1Z1W575_9ACTN|nr:DUF1643 domain-containing protein [Streptomyces alboflavus]ARX81571.1 hypothetical protein SMD44_00969 [Streptomyces alboflavus]